MIQRGLKDAGEMVAIGEAEIVGDGLDRIVGVGQAAGGLLNARSADKIAGRLLEVNAEKVREVFGAVSDAAGQILDRQRALQVGVHHLKSTFNGRRNLGICCEIQIAEKQV